MDDESEIVQEFFNNKDSVSKLEYLLDREFQSLLRLHRQRHLFDYGKTPSEDEVDSLFSDITKEVDRFLLVSSISEADWKFFEESDIEVEWYEKFGRSLNKGFLGMAVYSLLTKQFAAAKGFTIAGLIGIIGDKISDKLKLYSHGPDYDGSHGMLRLSSSENRCDTIEALAHEYGHHIQRDSGIPYPNFPCLCEGIGRGVERHIAQFYAQKEDNEAFLYRITHMTVGELKSAYTQLCKNTGTSPKLNLTWGIGTNRDYDEFLYRLWYSEPTPHAIGNAILYAKEQEQGKSVYGDTLKNLSRY